MTVFLFWIHLVSMAPLQNAVSNEQVALNSFKAVSERSIRSGADSMPGPADAAVRWEFANEQNGCSAPSAVSTPEVLAYLPADDAAARSSLARNCAAISTVLAETWLLEDWQGTLRLVGDAANPQPGPKVIPVLSLGHWLDPDQAAKTLSDPAFLSGLAFRLSLISEQPNAGLCLDLSSQDALPDATVVAAITALAGAGTRCLIGPAEATFWESSTLVEMLDLAVVQLFRRPSGPGQPPAPRDWFHDASSRIAALVPADKRVVALATRGFSWRSGQRGLQEADYIRTMTAAADQAAPVVFVPWANAARTRFVVGGEGVIETWIPDAVALQNQIAQIGPDQRLAVWPLGAEDPSIWSLFQRPQSVQAALEAPIRMDTAVRIQGEGPVIRAAALPAPGRRTVEVDRKTGLIVEADYADLPTPAGLTQGGGQDDHVLSLSFAALPPQRHWPALARLLATANIEATFLLETSDLLRQRELVQEVVAAGHLVGLKQPDRLPHVSRGQRIGDNFRQALMQERTGFGARVVEAGTVGDWTGIAATAAPLLDAGYVPLVPVHDARHRPFPTEATDQIGAVPPPAHDRISIVAGPSDWDAVLRDLPDLLKNLTLQAYQFQPLVQVAGLNRESAMPRLADPAVPLAASAVFAVLAFANDELNTIFFWFLIYSAARSVVYLGLSLLRRPKDDFNPKWAPPVTVLIPAYNEAKVIKNCIQSILGADYQNLKVVVVDDGSTDDTHLVVEEAFGHDNQVTLVRQANGGKWAAANRGLEVLDTPYFLIADADSIFTPETIGWLVQQFQDESVGAVAGVVEVGNRGSFLGRCQALEYLVSQSVMRRAQEVFEGILVVPGAVGAWRTQAVREAKLFSGNTVTEDADLTVAVHRAGYRVVFQEQARSVTEAPSSVGDFMRQRLRWTFGMLQTSWKHRGAIVEGRTVGYISIIDAIWFGVVSSIFAPLVDFLLLLLLGQGLWALATGGPALLASVPIGLFAAYFALTVLDVGNTLVAFWFEKRFDWKLLALVPILRFGYRQLLYVSTLRALAQAVTGTTAGWNKLNRTGATLSLWSEAAATEAAVGQAASSIANARGRVVD
ncbi:hypothetical protein DC363_16095 [Thalassorhabdomicrobium marinisediminis]|uniref:Glycosyltransferase n=1 Tax=Thalassorhabdomicrobium marinisediminis TaxID=2170577 RepID=A0A2T7FT55_9RHOB|nr:hypothetical protein DC363_16095 [Thalassorhabdomicrobium marinisediminis]